jgi:hypothetical protein
MPLREPRGGRDSRASAGVTSLAQDAWHTSWCPRGPARCHGMDLPVQHGFRASARVQSEAKYATQQQASPMRPSPHVRGMALGCKAFHTAPWTLVGMALRHRLRTGQRDDGAGKGLPAAASCSSLAPVHSALRSSARRVSKVEGACHGHEEALRRHTSLQAMRAQTDRRDATPQPDGPRSNGGARERRGLTPAATTRRMPPPHTRT